MDGKINMLLCYVWRRWSIGLGLRLGHKKTAYKGGYDQVFKFVHGANNPFAACTFDPA